MRYPKIMLYFLIQELLFYFKGHRDGIWDISVSRLGHPLIGTASADKTARIWGVDSGRCLTSYVGHNGSVNSIAFHPTQDLVRMLCFLNYAYRVFQLKVDIFTLRLLALKQIYVKNGMTNAETYLKPA